MSCSLCLYRLHSRGEKVNRRPPRLSGNYGRLFGWHLSIVTPRRRWWHRSQVRRLETYCLGGLAEVHVIVYVEGPEPFCRWHLAMQKEMLY